MERWDSASLATLVASPFAALTYAEPRSKIQRTNHVKTPHEAGHLRGGPGGIAPFGLFRCGVLGINSCARPRSTEPKMLRIWWVRIRMNVPNKKPQLC